MTALASCALCGGSREPYARGSNRRFYRTVFGRNVPVCVDCKNAPADELGIRNEAPSPVGRRHAIVVAPTSPLHSGLHGGLEIYG